MLFKDLPACRRITINCALFTAMAVTAQSASATVIALERYTRSDVKFLESDFSDARVEYYNEFSLEAQAAGESRGFRFNILNAFDSLSTYSESAIDLVFPTPVFDSDAGLYISDVTTTFNDPDSLRGRYFVEYNTSVVDGPSGGLDSFISRSQVERNGQLYWALHFSGGGSNFVDAGGRFYSEVTLPGEWNPLSTGTGSVEWSYNSDHYSVDHFFLAGAISTRFSVFTDDYTLLDPAGDLGSPGQNPGIRLTLIGPAIPEPSSAMALGVVGVLASRRRR